MHRGGIDGGASVEREEEERGLEMAIECSSWPRTLVFVDDEQVEGVRSADVKVNASSIDVITLEIVARGGVRIIEVAPGWREIHIKTKADES